MLAATPRSLPAMGGKRIPQKLGGPRRPAWHSGKRSMYPKSPPIKLLNKVLAVQRLLRSSKRDMHETQLQEFCAKVDELQPKASELLVWVREFVSQDIAGDAKPRGKRAFHPQTASPASVCPPWRATRKAFGKHFV